jgi:hypothetical protein
MPVLSARSGFTWESGIHADTEGTFRNGSGHLRGGSTTIFTSMLSSDMWGGNPKDPLKANSDLLVECL